VSPAGSDPECDGDFGPNQGRSYNDPRREPGRGNGPKAEAGWPARGSPKRSACATPPHARIPTLLGGRDDVREILR
jgi:hypothetical protein